jgi:acyl-[acyl-carrier-protein]-phospholipid O-acyltransferase / long-chain-fatty-acid--[acyl-carrier-protein] ligase
MNILKFFLRWLFTSLYHVEVKGLDYFHQAGDRVLIIANHTSYLDAVLLAIFLPDKLTFAVNTRIAKAWWVRPALSLVNFFPMDPTNPLSTKSLIKYLQQDRKAVIFPEGRITVTGSLMKIYQGPGMVADKSGASLLPVRIEGAQYTPFSHLRGRVRLRWFPRITLSLLAPRNISLDNSLKGRARRNVVSRVLAEIMTEMIFATSNYRRTLFDALLDARRVHGASHEVAVDIERRPLTYSHLLTRIFILADVFKRSSRDTEVIGLMLPTSISTVVSFMALQVIGRVPAMLNFTAGAKNLLSACEIAQLRTVYTSRQFVAAAKLEQLVAVLGEKVNIVYLEEIRDRIGMIARLKGLIASKVARTLYHHQRNEYSPDDAAVILFTSGTEGTPKGVVLSHANLIANGQQLAARIDFTAQDVILNALPLFHSFGLMAGTLLPLFAGIKIFFYPTPLHYRIIPEIAYDINATILFGTNTFLAGYARFAHPYDFYSIRYVFAGAEKLQEQTRQVWAEKFGIRILEGYGTTETSPALATNTAMAFRAGTVGRLLPGIEYRLQPVPGIEDGGRLEVRGPNVMLGYLKNTQPGVIQPVRNDENTGWYDTGDIVSIDDEGYIRICGRAKRFAKVGGEMVSLAAIENLASKLWPHKLHAAISIPDLQKGEQIVLVTEIPEASRQEIQDAARREGMSDISVPRRIIHSRIMPLLGSGKIDYNAVKLLVEQSNRTS